MSDERPEWAHEDEAIIVVDDSRTSARLMEIQLRSAGYDDVRVAGDGEEALNLCSERRPDIVLADVMMPGMNGLDLTRILRSDPQTADISIIMVSAANDAADKANGLEAGANDYISKPFDPTELLARIRNVVYLARERRSWSSATRMPGNVAVEREISRRIKAGEELAVLYVDVDGLRPYNKHYGYMLGDQLLRRAGKAALDAVASVDPDGGFAGHFVADEFVIVTTPSLASRMAEETISQFDKLAPSLYDPADAAQGFLESEDENGTVQKYPIVTLSIGVVTGPAESLEHPSLVIELAAKKMRESKKETGSSWAGGESEPAPSAPLET